MNSSGLESRILVYEKSGQSLKPIKIYHDSNGRKWIESRPGTKFVIEVKNNEYTSYLAVVSVDGLNVINAQKAKMEPHNGYVLDAKQSIKIAGWRTSLEDVREFVFTADKNQSYSHKLGADESNTGVIGLAFFRQKPNVWCGYTSSATSWPPFSPDYKWTTTCCLNSTPTAYSVTSVANSDPDRSTKSCLRSASFNMATAQGKKVHDEVKEVEREFEDTVSYTDIIYYDSRKNLIANGIIREDEDKMPQPFENNGFCPSL